jgi:hypothetical protein
LPGSFVSAAFEQFHQPVNRKRGRLCRTLRGVSHPQQPVNVVLGYFLPTWPQKLALHRGELGDSPSVSSIRCRYELYQNQILMGQGEFFHHRIDDAPQICFPIGDFPGHQDDVILLVKQHGGIPLAESKVWYHKSVVMIKRRISKKERPLSRKGTFTGCV